MSTEDKFFQCLRCNFAGRTEDLCLLDCLPVASRCEIIEIQEPSENILRLMEMGLIPGTSVTIERTAPLNSPFSVRLPGCTLAVRREDAHHLLVNPLPPLTTE